MNKKYIVVWILIWGIFLILLYFDMKSSTINNQEESQSIMIEKLEIKGSDMRETEYNISVSDVDVEPYEELNIQRK